MANKTIAAAGLISVGVGSANAIANHKTLPSTKFLLGSGVLFLTLSAMADAGAEELAQALSIAVMTTILLGEGNGLLSWISPHNEVNTQRPKAASVSRGERALSSGTNDPPADVFKLRATADIRDSVTAFPGIPAA